MLERFMFRVAILSAVCICTIEPGASGQESDPTWHMVYTRSHRATFEQEWKYVFPNHKSNQWFIALRYPPELAWSRDVVGKAELRTSTGWKPFREVVEESRAHRRMLVIDYPGEDPLLHKGFTLRTSITATIYDQRLERGGPAKPVAPLTPRERQRWLEETETYDFHAPTVKKWMDNHNMWKGKDEATIDFVHRVYKQLRVHMPYSTKDGGKWVCSQILQVNFGECCRHSIVTTSILRANQIPARTVCALWAIDHKSEGAHCWGEFFLHGVGWVPYDTTIGDDKNSEAYFGAKKGELLAGMVDFDWVIDAGPFGKKHVPSIDAFPAFWSKGTGNMDNEKCDTHTSVRILKD
jgi:transglutaminase-like putative cysteine protease